MTNYNINLFPVTNTHKLNFSKPFPQKRNAFSLETQYNETEAKRTTIQWFTANVSNTWPLNRHAKFSAVRTTTSEPRKKTKHKNTSRNSPITSHGHDLWPCFTNLAKSYLTSLDVYKDTRQLWKGQRFVEFQVVYLFLNLLNLVH